MKEAELMELARTGWKPSERVARSVREGIPARLEADPTFGADAPGPRDVATRGEPMGATRWRAPWGQATGLALVGLTILLGARSARDDAPRSSTAPQTSAAPVSAPPPHPPEPPPVDEQAPTTATVGPSSLPDVRPARAPRKAAASVPPRASAERRAERAPVGDTIAEEVALVRAAQASLREGAPTDALATLSTHASRFPSGVLRDERMTLQVLALCALGEIEEARSVRSSLEKLAPASTHLQRLSCADR